VPAAGEVLGFMAQQAPQREAVKVLLAGELARRERLQGTERRLTLALAFGMELGAHAPQLALAGR